MLANSHWSNVEGLKLWPLYWSAVQRWEACSIVVIMITNNWTVSGMANSWLYAWYASSRGVSAGKLILWYSGILRIWFYGNLIVWYSVIMLWSGTAACCISYCIVKHLIYYCFVVWYCNAKLGPRTAVRQKWAGLSASRESSYLSLD